MTDRQVIAVHSVVVLIVASIGILLYWLNNPSITEMELFKQFWWCYAIVGGYYLRYGAPWLRE